MGFTYRQGGAYSEGSDFDRRELLNTVMTTTWSSMPPVYVVQHAMLHIHALSKGKVIEGTCYCWKADASNKETSVGPLWLPCQS